MGRLENTLENKLAPFIEAKIGAYIQERAKGFHLQRRGSLGMSKSFLDGGYDCVFGDLMFGLGLPFAVHTEKSLNACSPAVAVVGAYVRDIYPTGEKQEKRVPSGNPITSGAR